MSNPHPEIHPVGKIKHPSYKYAEAMRLYEEDGLSLVRISERLDIPDSTIRGWKRRAKPRWKRSQPIKELADMPREELVKIVAAIQTGKTYQAPPPEKVEEPNTPEQQPREERQMVDVYFGQDANGGLIASDQPIKKAYRPMKRRGFKRLVSQW